MTRTRAILILGVGLLALALAFVLPQPGAGQSTPARRTIYMAAVEPKGGTSVSSEPFPTAALPQGPGYVLRQPDQTGRWEVSGYYWQPGFVMAYEGENVTLEILGINGAEHTGFIEGLSIPAFTVKRGQVTTVNFRTGRPGFYRITCASHMPTMVGYLVVLPKR